MIGLAIIISAVVLGVVWRVVRAVIRLALLAAIVAAGAWYVHQHAATSHATDLPRPGTTGRVVWAIDGDTLDVVVGHRSERVRLLGVDAPESSSTRFGRPDCGGRLASENLRQLARVGAQVSLTTDPRSGAVRDRYGRLLAYVTTEAGRDLGEVQLADGMAVLYRYDQRRFSRLSAYEHAERSARTAHRGVWKLCDGRFHTPV